MREAQTGEYKHYAPALARVVDLERGKTVGVGGKWIKRTKRRKEPAVTWEWWAGVARGRCGRK